MKMQLERILYKLTGRKRTPVDVSVDVKKVIEETDRKMNSQNRQDKRKLDFVESIDVYGDPSDGIAEIVCKMDEYRKLHDAIEQLTATQRRRLLLYYFHGLTQQEIAKKEKVSQSKISHSIKRALEHLRELLTE